MILTIHDHTQQITVGQVAPETAVRLAGMLPSDVRLSVRPDETFEREPAHDPGYFGLATAITYDTWGEPPRITFCQACSRHGFDARRPAAGQHCQFCGSTPTTERDRQAYAAYRRGELSDPRD